MAETIKQRIFRAIIATTVSLFGGLAILYYGYQNYPLVQQYWLLPVAIMLVYVLYKDVQIIRGRD